MGWTYKYSNNINGKMTMDNCAYFLSSEKEKEFTIEEVKEIAKKDFGWIDPKSPPSVYTGRRARKRTLERNLIST